jgi:uncharacterized membrane-anchored protein YitT (DUF2179 family)
MKYQKKLKEYLIVTVATFIVAAAFNTFFLPFNMVIGGSSGVAIIFDYLFHINPATTVLLMHILILILGYFLLEHKLIIHSIYGSLAYPFFIHLTSPLRDYVLSLNVTGSDVIVFIIFGAVITGIGLGIIYKYGYTTGGSDIIDHILNKYLGITIGTASFLFNFIIVTVGGFTIGYEKLLYTVLILYIRGISTDKILIGNYSNKIFYIITKESEQVKKFICNELHLKVTQMNSIGGYSNTEKPILMCVVSNRDYFKLKEGINKIDKEAFFLITHAHN